MSKILLTFQDENIINSIDLDHNSLPLNSSKRIANFRHHVFLSLREPFLTSPSPYLFLRATFLSSPLGDTSYRRLTGVWLDC